MIATAGTTAKKCTWPRAAPAGIGLALWKTPQDFRVLVEAWQRSATREPNKRTYIPGRYGTPLWQPEVKKASQLPANTLEHETGQV
jgi:hypothetical protein